MKTFSANTYNVKIKPSLSFAAKHEESAFCFALTRGGARQFHLGGATGGASFATRRAVNGLCRTSFQWHDVTRKIWEGHWGG